MSDLTRQMWLDAWRQLENARASFGEAITPEQKRSALQDMISISDVFKASCVSFASAIGYARRAQTYDRPSPPNSVAEEKKT